MTEKTGVVGVPAEPTDRDEMIRQLKHYTISHLLCYPHCGAPTEEEIDAALAAPPSPLPAPVEPTADQIDAKRYRWLRDKSNDIEWPTGCDWAILGGYEGAGFDAIIDAVMEQP